MSSSIFKIIAIISMFCDHIGMKVYSGINWLRLIGRISFPIFAWQISVGADKTKNIKKYVLRLLIFALVSQPFYMLFMNDLLMINYVSFNIGFTLLFGLLCIIGIKKDIRLGIFVTILLSFIAEKFNLGYGWYGILMIVVFYIFKDYKFLNFIGQLFNFLAYYYINNVWHQGISLISILMILLFYNEKKGKNIKWFFYIFYPLHFLILYLYFKCI